MNVHRRSWALPRGQPLERPVKIDSVREVKWRAVFARNPVAHRHTVNLLHREWDLHGDFLHNDKLSRNGVETPS